MLEVDGRSRVCALSHGVTQAGQVSPETRRELPWNARALSVDDRMVQQGRVQGRLPRVELLARTNPWLHRARSANVMARNGDGRARVSRSHDDEPGDEQNLKNEATGYSQRNHPGYASMLRPRTPQFVRLPGSAAVAWGRREHGRILARRWLWVQGVTASATLPSRTCCRPAQACYRTSRNSASAGWEVSIVAAPCRRCGGRRTVMANLPFGLCADTVASVRRLSPWVMITFILTKGLEIGSLFVSWQVSYQLP
jgi:hypothetical protein